MGTLPRTACTTSHAFPRCHRAHGFWIDRGGMGGRREVSVVTGASPVVIPFFPVFLDRYTAVSHYTPRLHPDSNHTILGIELKSI